MGTPQREAVRLDLFGGADCIRVHFPYSEFEAGAVFGAYPYGVVDCVQRVNQCGHFCGDFLFVRAGRKLGSDCKIPFAREKDGGGYGYAEGERE